MEKLRVTDTHPEIERRLASCLQEKTPEERVLMGVSMFRASKLMILERLKRENPSAAEDELKKLLLNELYGHLALFQLKGR